jgi:hypothetical protein
MRGMVLVKATDHSEKGILPTPEMFEAMGKYNEELIKVGILRAGDGLKPSSQGKRIAFDGPHRTVIDGPFADPNPMPGPSEVEIRPLYEMGDFDEAHIGT